MHYIKCGALSLNKTLARDLVNDLSDVIKIYPFQVSAHYAALIRRKDDAIWRQCIPDPRELEDDEQISDPLAETALSPVPGLIHRYPDRVVLLVSNRCPVYCRFCMRKRHVGEGEKPLEPSALQAALAYIASKPSIRDVILSGGDPLMLNDSSLYHVLSSLRTIKHLSVIRIGTRIPVTLPDRVTPELCDMLKQFHPLYINTHFNHPSEITPESAQACALLADAGIPLGNQSVLLRGVNDTVECMRELVTGLLGLRIRPYYIHQMDLVKGTGHFRTSVATGLEIMRGLRGHISGLAVPHYVIDLPNGKGKVPLLPEMVVRKGKVLTLTTYHGEQISYKDLDA